MTSCAECLSALSTSSVSQLGSGSAVALHCATCADCARVAEDIRYAEYRLATALNEMRSGTDPQFVAAAAADESELWRRKRIGRLLRLGLAAAVLVTGWFAVVEVLPNTGFFQESPGAVETKTYELACLTPEAASDLVTPYLQSNGSAVYIHPNPRAITMRGRHRELEYAISQLIRFDNRRLCELPGSGSNTPESGDLPISSPPPGADDALPGASLRR